MCPVEQIPIGGAPDVPDNVVHLPGGRSDPEAEPDIEVTDDASVRPEVGETGVPDGGAPTVDPEPQEARATGPAAMDPAIGALIEQSARILGGFVSATSAAITNALRDVAPTAPSDEDDDLDVGPTEGPSPVGLATGAAVGLTMQVSEAAVQAATSFARTAGPLLSWITSTPAVRRGASDVETRVEALNDRWAQERPTSEEAASSFVGRLLPEITGAILDKLDLTQIAIDHLDIDRILDSVDLDAVIERVDLNAVIHRVDLATIATEVITEIDLPELIRESTGAVTSETVRTVRMRSAEADLLLGRIIDRILFRKAATTDDGDGDAPAQGSAS